MRLAVDTTILLSALGRQSQTRRLLLLADLDSIVFDGAFEALRRHLPLLTRRTRTRREVLAEAIDTLARYVTEVPLDRYRDAYRGLDLAYPWASVRELEILALAKAERVGIWSLNAALEQADDLRIWKTEELVKEAVR